MAALGVKKFDDLIGRSDFLCKQGAIDHWKAKDIDLTKILWRPSTVSQKKILIPRIKTMTLITCLI